MSPQHQSWEASDYSKNTKVSKSAGNGNGTQGVGLFRVTREVLSEPEGAGGAPALPSSPDQDPGWGSVRSCLTPPPRIPLLGCLWGTVSPPTPCSAGKGPRAPSWRVGP